ncbi:metallophosphoesterase [candidate division WOR-3 bacterium]|nr:metallophosphoesterase [candidate division WOR-3 bacterium]
MLFIGLFVFLLSSTNNLGKPYIYPDEKHPKEYRELLLEQEPVIEIDKEKKEAIITVKTRLEVLPIGVHYGLYIPSKSIKIPRFRRLAVEKGKESSISHKISLSLSIFEHPRYDLCNFAKEGGVIYYRLEIRNPHYAVNTFYDGRFRIDGDYLRVPCIISGPFVDQVGQKSAIISWETDIPEKGCVVIKSREFRDEKESCIHEILLNGLKTDREYKYSVKVGDAVRGEYHFKTAPDNNEKFEFVFLSDSRGASGGGERYFEGSCNFYIFSTLLNDAYNKGADFILFGGDLINGYVTDEFDFRHQLKSWKKVSEQVGAFIPIYEGMGNHEALMDAYDDRSFDKATPLSAEDIFREEFVNPENGPTPEESFGYTAPPYKENVYYFDYGNSRFISFNTNYAFSSNPEEYGGNLEGYVMDGQLHWLKKVIKEANKSRYIKHIFLFGHEPSFPNGWHSRDAQWYSGKKVFVIDRRDDLWRIISNSKKSVAVFYGDEHNYSRMLVDWETVFYEKDGYIPENPLNPRNPVWQIISGGAGAPYYTQENTLWRESVRSFYPGHHYCFFRVDGDIVELKVFNEMGELVDQCLLRH